MVYKFFFILFLFFFCIKISMNAPQIMETVLRYAPTQMEATSVPAEVVIYWVAIA